MIFLLDTNACIRYLNSPDSALARRLASLNAADIRLCSVVKAELLYGALHSGNPTRALSVFSYFAAPFTSIPFDDLAAEAYGRIRADLASRGTPIGPNDLMIAAIAVANDLTLITHNVREFSRVDGLHFEDWEQS
jgi:tRNA(fMet)-specific endonuclease VapC